MNTRTECLFCAQEIQSNFLTRALVTRDGAETCPTVVEAVRLAREAGIDLPAPDTRHQRRWVRDWADHG